MRDSGRHVARRGRGRRERDQPEHPARPSREPARQRVGAAAGRGARRGERTHRRSAEAHEQAGIAADVRRILRKQAAWEEAVALDGDDAASSGCSRSTDSPQPGQPDSVRGCASRNAAGWPKRWRRCATTIETERRCPVRRRQRRRGGRIRSASDPGRSPPAWVASRRPDTYRAGAPRPCRAPSSRGTSPVSSAPGRSQVTAGFPLGDCGGCELELSDLPPP